VGAEIEMISLEEREYRLRKALQSLKDDYEFIFIDCAPSLGLITLKRPCGFGFCYYSGSM
jgi:chromosome partitioning protein